MPAMNTSTVVGVFEYSGDAERAVAELRDAGFADAQIGVTRRIDVEERDEEPDEATEVGAGAAAGAVTGLGLGALAGLGVLSGVLPVIGPAIAGGTLGVILSNAAAGAGVAGLVGALVGAGIPEREAAYYHEEVISGRTILTVDAGGRSTEARDILLRNGSIDDAKPRRVDVSIQSEILGSGGEATIGDRP